ncbi:hypothetical protein [Catellatospora tritici]|uniref:hypothetical protein n=1 Tax=Catellatospora tritici TaxID=2851566 RepID=UPI001C2CFD6C|nr:hypothetical protein [Catellatospora tritici]MBV1856366.1 hypothetical protein [Catellatospora tritici]
MPDELERRYRRLLLAYPARYRRYRGLEMLTTLMDLAPQGRRRPTFMETVSLLAGGLRCRVALGGASMTVAVLTAVLLAMVGGLAGARIGWEQAPDLPDDAAAAAIAHSADPALPASVTQRRDFLFGYDYPPVQGIEEVLVAVLGGDEYTPGYVKFTRAHATDDLATLLAARDRLAAQGWRVSAVDRQPWGGEFEAFRGDLYLSMDTQGGNVGELETSMWIERVTPPAVPWLTVAGLLLGAYVGWRLAGWAGRRHLTRPAWRRITAMLAFALGVGLMAPPAAFNVLGLTGALWSAVPQAPWIGFYFILLRGLALAGSLLLVSALLITALPAPRTHPLVHTYGVFHK